MHVREDLYGGVDPPRGTPAAIALASWLTPPWPSQIYCCCVLPWVTPPMPRIVLLLRGGVDPPMPRNVLLLRGGQATNLCFFVVCSFAVFSGAVFFCSPSGSQNVSPRAPTSALGRFAPGIPLGKGGSTPLRQVPGLLLLGG